MRVVLANSVGWCGMQQSLVALREGGSPLDAVEEGIKAVEADPSVHSVGRGGWPNLLGQVELDASIIDGRSGRAGAVGALQGYLHPISVARKVMELLPHVLLVGDGAARFAEECGMERADNLTAEARQAWEEWREQHVSPGELQRWPPVRLSDLAWLTADPVTATGTTVFLVRGANGHICSGVSTSGWAWKYPGRLGDSPLIGAGSYADERYGAAACVGHGELAIRAGTARSVVLYMKMGMDVEQACHEAINDLRALERDYRAEIIIHAMDRDGGHFVVGCGADEPPSFCLWTDSMAGPEVCIGALECW